MGKAKTASKNNPTQREKAAEIFFNGKKVKPVRFFDVERGTSYIAIQYDDNSGTMAEDGNGDPLPWSAATNN
jgi:hypothetical protein